MYFLIAPLHMHMFTIYLNLLINMIPINILILWLQISLKPEITHPNNCFWAVGLDCGQSNTYHSDHQQQHSSAIHVCIELVWIYEPQ